LYFLGPVIVWFSGHRSFHFTKQMAVNWHSKIVCAYHIAHTRDTLAAVGATFKLLSSAGTTYFMKENIIIQV
jgi:hypothetical protein